MRAVEAFRFWRARDCIEMSSAMAAGIEEEGDNLCDRCGLSMCFCWFELRRFDFAGVGDDITLWQN